VSVPQVRRRSLSFALVLGLLGAAACSGELVLTSPGDSVGGDDPGGIPDAGAAVAAAVREGWDANVVPLFSTARPLGTCLSCHATGAAFAGSVDLGATGPDGLEKVLAKPGMIGATVAESRFLKGEHTGNGFCTGAGTPVAACTTDEASVVRAWVEVVLAN
jgi:hypothetical protein